MKYESAILKRLIDTYGVVGNPHYISEIIKEFIVQGKERFPNLFTYQADWLAHIDEFGLTPDYVVSYTGQQIYAPNTKEKPVKRAILTGSTKYRDIDTGEFLETFEEGRNLELVSVKMPVLTTSNEDGTKTNILTTPSDLELRSVGDVKDELDCLTGEYVQHIKEDVIDGTSDKPIGMVNVNDTTLVRFNIDNVAGVQAGNTNKILCSSLPYLYIHGLSGGSATVSQECISNHSQDENVINVIIKRSRLSSVDVEGFRAFLQSNPITIQYPIATHTVKTVDLTIHDKDQQKVERLTSFDGGTHFTTSSQEGSLLPTISVDVVTDLEETLKVCSLEGNTM